MSWQAGHVAVLCPRCGQVSLVPVTIAWVGAEYAHSKDKDGWVLKVTFTERSNGPEHHCIAPVLTDGLAPIERFLTNGALDDQGSRGRRAPFGTGSGSLGAL